MCDPTFTRQFAMATQADILRQAERDRLRATDRLLDNECRVARQRRPIRHLAALLRRVLQVGPQRAGTLEH